MEFCLIIESLIFPILDECAYCHVQLFSPIHKKVGANVHQRKLQKVISQPVNKVDITWNLPVEKL